MSLSRVSTEMGDCSQVYCFVVRRNHSGQLSLAIPPWVGVIITAGEGYGYR